MNILESIQIALDGLVSNKLRAILTMLGVIIGVAAVITMLGVGRGAQQQITSQIQANGSNLLYISPGSSREGQRTASNTPPTLTYDDAKALMEAGATTTVEAVSATINTFAQIVYQSQNTMSQVTGVPPEALQVNNMKLARGSFIDSSHLQSRQTVAVLGATAAKDLFGTADPIGQTVRISNIQFKIIGVLAAKGGTGFGSQDGQIYVPLTTAQARLINSGSFRGSSTLSQITVKIKDESMNDLAIQQVSSILRQRHRVTEDDFTVLSQKQLLETVNETTQVFTLVLSAIAAISLLVGGIGIMNIMLVSVTERTREIGLRKAVGARKGDIMAQFLVEASVISILGGFIGVGLAYGLSYVMAGARLGNMSFTPVIGMDSVLMATLFSVGVGLFFGLYPANRAAALNPIEALRYE